MLFQLKIQNSPLKGWLDLIEKILYSYDFHDKINIAWILPHSLFIFIENSLLDFYSIKKIISLKKLSRTEEERQFGDRLVCRDTPSWHLDRLPFSPSGWSSGASGLRLLTWWSTRSFPTFLTPILLVYKYIIFT